MNPEKRRGRVNDPERPISLPRETVALDEDLRRLVVDLCAIDRETRRYHRKLEGVEPWTELYLPPSLREAS
jgi:hypothetical protein